MRRYIFFIMCYLLIFSNVKAQLPEDSVKMTINKLFAAMKNSDSKTLAECFANEAIFQTVTEKDGNVSVQTVLLKEFTDFVKAQKKGDAHGRIIFDVIKMDGALASAWTFYQYYYKGELNHCGVDSYQLVRVKGEWKIQYIIETTRETNSGQ